MPDMEPTVVSGEELRTCTIGRTSPDGSLADVETHTDLRGSPVGDKVLVWRYDRLLRPRGGRRQVREHLEIMYCAAGWHSTSGTADAPDDPELCNTIFSQKWRKGRGGEERFKRFWEFHEKNPVTWIVKTSADGPLSSHRLAWCDPELPPEYRPTGWAERQVR